jgi:hypothetical protein
MNIVSSAIEKARDKFNGGNFIYYAKLLENGTVIESFDKPIDENIPFDDDIVSDVGQPPLRLLNALLGGDHHMIASDAGEREMLPGVHQNWKGRPLPIGKPVVEELEGSDIPPYRRNMFRECRPIKFHYATLCHDLNNFFTCAAMHTGLPRWFFLSLILLCSFFMLWLGIFILSMIRRMKRQEVSGRDFFF